MVQVMWVSAPDATPQRDFYHIFSTVQDLISTLGGALFNFHAAF